ncbi:hypothetical protein CEXT_26171 [Caerostris extrusa]|uniref:Uncharacterized protein n=1 Tax=Caerostris extrusa TaxID=172846 RepID=A0AAV4Q3U5_CAEEX|nr:hypothetical protein CEXT_26171 [Caerostris extrusa]
MALVSGPHLFVTPCFESPSKREGKGGALLVACTLWRIYSLLVNISPGYAGRRNLVNNELTCKTITSLSVLSNSLLYVILV